MKSMSIGAILGISLIFAGIAVLILSMCKANGISVTEKSLVISGNYSMTLDLSEIHSVELTDSLPRITMRTNGIGAGSIQVGHFLMKDIGKCRLYLNLKYPPYVHVITTGGAHIFFNTKDPERTRELFSAIRNSVQPTSASAGNQSKASPE